MDNVCKLKSEYELAKKGIDLPDGERVKCYMDFVKILIANDSQEVINYHYELLKERENRDLYHHIRASFKRRPQAEEFLLKKIKTETDSVTLGDILHLLGGVRSAYANTLARQFNNSKDDYQREVALYVLGWTGEESDIDILNSHLLSESSSHLRITAASAHRQIYYRLPELKNKLLMSLKKGFLKEDDDRVISWIIIMVGSISKKGLGLREDREDPYIIHGDLQKAKLKTSKYLDEIDTI